MRPTLYEADPEDLGSVLVGEPAYRSDQLRHWLYRTPVLTTSEMTNLPPAMREEWSAELWPFRVEVEQTADDGRTVKWLFRADDGASIETVVMGYRNRTTVCISSQAGCAMACTFCATGQFGFERHLTAGEMVAQVAYAQAHLKTNGLSSSPDHVTNVVFMGMGEPLANYPRVRETLRRLIDVMGLSARSITVSTVGAVPGMKALTEDPWPVTLAVSLHAADDTLRSTLVPLNDRYPLADVEAAAAEYFNVKGRRVSIEWTLINEVNDSPVQARKLAAIAKRLKAHVNVIALNPTPLSPMAPSGEERILAFMHELRRAGANATRRDTRGQDIDAACGQLRVREARISLSPSEPAIAISPPEL